MSESRELAAAIAKLAEGKVAKAARKTRTQTRGRVTMVNPDGSVVVDAGYGNTPAMNTSVEVKIGDEVAVTVEDEKATITGNYTRPATDDSKAKEAGKKAESAQATAVHAEQSAAQAQESAESAIRDAQRANEAATQAALDAASAAISAADAAESASDAQADARTARDSATAATADAEAAATSAGNAETSARNASSAASEAQSQAQAATTAAQQAQSQAQAASTAAYEAKADASSAKQSAEQATVYSNAALDQFGVVQDVIGVLDWASSHGTFAKTSDTSVQDGKVYFTYDSTTGDYTPVVEPQASQLSNYYELSMTEAMNDFILAHLAVTSRGLWVLPSGKGSASSEQNAPGYKVLLSNSGMTVYDSAGVAVVTYGAGITFDTSRPFAIGDPDSTNYIAFVPGQGIKIGGSVSIGDDKTLSDMLEEIDGIPTTLGQLENDVGYTTGEQVSRNFYQEDEPEPPYSVGDTWMTGSGTVKVCAISKDEGDSYDASDWVDADDTAKSLANLSADIGQVETNLKAEMSSTEEKLNQDITDAAKSAKDALDGLETKVDSELANAQEWRNYLRFTTEDGLTIGQSDSSLYRQVMDAHGTHWQYDGEDAASVQVDAEGNGVMVLDRSEVADRMRIGDYVWINRGGRINLRYDPVEE